MTKINKAVRFSNGETFPYANIWDRAIAANECEVLKGETARTALTEYHRAKLLEVIQPGTTLTVVYTGGSGMSSRYKVFAPAISPTGKIYIHNITLIAAKLAGFRLSKDGEIVMGGCGYSKPFQIGYDIGRSLWPHGTPEPHGHRNGEPDNDGGYAIDVNAA